MTLPAVDWAQPWLAPYRTPGEAVAQAALHGSVAPALQRARLSSGMPGMPDFVAQHALPAGRAYEAHIFQTRSVPTRDNLHDLFNGLVWLAFPQAKRRLNELQAGEIARAGVSTVRGPLRDALTLFDENGALLHAPPALWQALVARDWHTLFVTRRGLWNEARLLLFGHALLEKLVTPRKPITAHVLCVPGRQGLHGPTGFDDAAIAASFDAKSLETKPFVPLPVLGVPGWCAENEAASFYADTQVFRPLAGASAR
ncbi:DUF3025 domain-containing protein [Variovorax sp. J22G73]|uniref:DUF3025 domain-containing protein n=1 Tax=unclassified Variovorax TaxID=663243 RepID=UPI00257602F0|nr:MULTISPECIES: DUF3025 domain-containing protein [unclassified Variovorax]MDM0008745.1 DUF3025 domain-containing protein [Variovorax sp. J22R203]MDM0101419.1 DUF3025 domain-containing protein [Variovorax sp. J22G73]